MASLESLPSMGLEGGSWSSGYYLGVSYIIFSTVFTLSGLLLLYRRRNVHPVKGREPVLVVFTALAVLAHGGFLAVRFVIGPDFPCYVALFHIFASVIVIGNLYLVRCWLLFFRFAATHEQMKMYPIFSRRMSQLRISQLQSMIETPNRSRASSREGSSSVKVVSVSSAKSISNSKSKSKSKDVSHSRAPKSRSRSPRKRTRTRSFLRPNSHNLWYASHQYFVSPRFLSILYFIKTATFLQDHFLLTNFGFDFEFEFDLL